VTRRAGVPVGRKHGGFVFHNSRHTAVTNLVNAGVPAHEAMAISGHRTRSVFDRYSLTLKAQTRAALERVSTALPATLPPAHVLPLPTSRRRRRDANGDTLAHTPHEDEAKVCSGKAAKGAES
jgi:hypothetical protein